MYSKSRFGVLWGLSLQIEKYLKWQWNSDQTNHSATVQYWIKLTYTQMHTGIFFARNENIPTNLYWQIISPLHVKLLIFKDTSDIIATQIGEVYIGNKWKAIIPFALM